MRKSPYDNIATQLTLTIVDGIGNPRSKTIHPLNEDRLEHYVRLGTGTTEDPEVAISMASQHVANFFYRGSAYRLVHGRDAEIVEKATKRPFGLIEFYRSRREIRRMHEHFRNARWNAVFAEQELLEQEDIQRRRG